MSLVKRIAEIPIPDKLNEIQRAEYIAFQDAMTDLENEWIGLENGTNPEQIACLEQIQEIKNKRYAQADERLKLRVDIIEKQFKKESERIETEQEEYKKLLFDRLMRAYSQSYQSIVSQLKELMGKEFATFNANNSIEFPSFVAEGQMRTRLQQPEEGKPRLHQSDVEKDIKLIQSIIQKSNQDENK